MLKFDAGTRTRILAAMTLDFDPTGSTIELKVDGVWYDAIWLDTPVECDNGKWEQEAQTIQYFAGPEVHVDDVDGAVLLGNAPRHRTQTRVSFGNDILAWDSSTIELV